MNSRAGGGDAELMAEAQTKGKRGVEGKKRGCEDGERLTVEEEAEQRSQPKYGY